MPKREYMSKLNLFIQSQVTENNISKERQVYNEGQLDISSSVNGETMLATLATKNLFTGLSKYVYVQSDKACEITLNGTIVLNIEPLEQGIALVDGILALSGGYTSVSVKNLATTSATIKFLITE
jgi:hypothetical protein